MRRVTACTVLLAACVSAGICDNATAGELRAWGADYDGQVTQAPTGGDYVAIAVGDAHGLALRPDGAVVAWGQNYDGQCEVPSGTYRAIGAGADFSLAIRGDGSIAAWGNDTCKQVSGVPADRDFVAVDGGEFFAVGLKADGSIVAWGDDRWGQVSKAPTGGGFQAVAAGDDHAVALRFDGSLVAWGDAAAIQGMPTTGTYTAIDAGGSFCLAVRSDGAVVWWGDDSYGYGLAKVPAGTDFVDVAAGYLHGLALKTDGTVVGWGAGIDASGHPHWGQASPPPGNDYTAIACGLYFSLGLVAGKPVIADDFDDNRQAGIWQVAGLDLMGCHFDEVNQRLELRSTSKSQGIPAYYISSGWRIDPAYDFSCKVSFHYGLSSERAGWVSLGLTPDANDPGGRHVEFGAGCDRLYRYLWYESVDGTRRMINFADRRENDGVLYLSYDTARDELYLSSSGYGSKNAWMVVPGLLQFTWRGAAAHVLLGGGADGLEIQSGEVYLDDFVVEKGTLEKSALADVYRFWSPVTRQHFYTISESEKDKLIKEFSHIWTFEGVVFRAASVPSVVGVTSVWRFWAPGAKTHFYTISEREKDKLIKEFSDVYTFEGVAFYAWPEGKQPSAALPVYRFWKPRDNSHFYTASERERAELIKDFPHIYVYEGVAFYAYP